MGQTQYGRQGQNVNNNSLPVGGMPPLISNQAGGGTYVDSAPLYREPYYLR